MQCKPVTEMPTGEEWSFELKLDGYRCVALKHGGAVALWSRNQKSLNQRFPGVVKALEALAGEFVLDGELVALDPAGRPSFQLLQNEKNGDYPVQYYVFDLLQREGTSLLSQPLEERRAQLAEFLSTPDDPIRLSPLLRAPAGEVLQAVQQLGLEGVIGKQRGSLYEPGERSGAWIKYRTNREQEFVIGGYVPGAKGFDALLVGIYEGRKLGYVAKVKNGFPPRLRAELFPSLQKLSSATCPFHNLPETKSSRWGEPMTAEKMKECRWLKPKLVAQVAFVEWTDAGHLRHCTFIGMRDDKKATTVVRET